MNDISKQQQSCCPSNDSGLDRRRFMQGALATGVTAAIGTSTFQSKMVFAGDKQTYGHLIPSDKKLSKAWLNSLYARTEGEVYSDWQHQLKYIGMPVGGIGCGQLYLGGDGRLWLWDIFKSNYRREPDHGQRINAFTLGGHYAEPVAFGEEYTKYNGTSVEQGFVIKVVTKNKTYIKTLDHIDFPDVSFRGEYPVGKVTYSAKDFPVKVTLSAFSPFIPLEAEESALPATIMSFNVENLLSEELEVELLGWLQNATCPYTEDTTLGQRYNKIYTNDKLTTLHQGIKGSDGNEVLKKKHGFGSMALSLLNNDSDAKVLWSTNLQDASEPAGLFQQTKLENTYTDQSLSKLFVGALSSRFTLSAGKSNQLDYLISWYFPDYNEVAAAPGQLSETPGFEKLSRHYKNRFDDAAHVASYIAEHQKKLLGTTRLWNETWYDSTLPHWLLDRSFIAIDCIATQMFHWFDNGRPYAWEGVDCCPGTCTHVWHYAQGLARIFPDLERRFRKVVDYGVGFNQQTGEIYQRGDWNPHGSTDGHAGTILRVYREHQMSTDSLFLKSLWPKIKLSVQHLMQQDSKKNGLLYGEQVNTLDAAWYGAMAWVSGLYLAALTAGKAMAIEMDDSNFADQCELLLAKGRQSLLDELYNGEYFIHKPDPNKPKAISSGIGCHIDQVLGQAWLHQVGLERVFAKPETVSALNSLWRYNFAPDAGQYAIDQVDIENAFRWYAMEGEAGLVMCSWPTGEAEKAIPGNKQRPKINPEVWTGPGGYFNECMNGFEYQVAWHMIAEGEPNSLLVEKGLAITKAVHERYSAEKRNPYNEIECSDHYARSMASYGVFIAACGFEYHGPKGYIKFTPKLSPHNFKAPFTSSQGWGSYSQVISEKALLAKITVVYGELMLNSIGFSLASSLKNNQVKNVFFQGKNVTFKQKDNEVDVFFNSTVNVETNDVIEIQLLTE